MESGYGNAPGIERLEVGIAALDRALGGGLPKRRSALVTGGTEQLALLDVEADQHYSPTPLVETISHTMERIKAERVAPWAMDGKRPFSPASGTATTSRVLAPIHSVRPYQCSMVC